MGSQLIVIRSFSFLPGLVGITYTHDIKIGLMDLWLSAYYTHTFIIRKMKKNLVGTNANPENLSLQIQIPFIKFRERRAALQIPEVC